MLVRLWIAACLSLLTITAVAQEQIPCTAFPHAAPVRTPPPHVADVEHMRLYVDVRPEKPMASGRAELRLEMPAAADSLVLRSEAAVDSVFAGVAGIPAFSIPFREAGDDSLVLDLSALRASGVEIDSTLRLGIPFQAEVHLEDDDAWTLDAPEPWFPWIGRVDDRFPVEIIVDVPADWYVAAPGLPSAQRGGDVFLFTSPHPLPPTEIDFIASRVEPSMSFARLPGSRQAGVVTLGGDGPSRVPEVLTFLSEWTGVAYPFERYVQYAAKGVEAASAAGLSIAPGTYWGRRIEESPYYRDAGLAALVARQWFGTIVSSASISDTWIGEGLSTYLGAVFVDRSGELETVMRQLQSAYEAEAERYVRPLVWSRWNHPSEMLDEHARAKGAWIAHMLRRRMGDADFRASIEKLLTKHTFESVSTADLIAAFEEVTSEDLSAFADEWIYAAGHPILAVSYEPDGDRLRVRIEQIQTGEGVPEDFSLDLRIEIGALDAVEQYEITVDERIEEVHVPFSSRPRYLAVDPQADWLLAVETDQSPAAWVAQLRHASTPQARMHAAQKLAVADGDPALLLGLRSALESEQDSAVRAKVIRAIGTFDTEAARRAVIGALDDPSPSVRAAALSVLPLQGERSTQLAMRSAQNDPAPVVQAQAVRTLADLEASAALDVARSALITPSEGGVIRAAGLYALRRLHRQEPRVALEAALAYSYRGEPALVRVEAVRLLGELADANNHAASRLRDLLSESSEAIRTAAAAELYRLGRTEDLTSAAAAARPAFRAQLTALLSCD